MKENIEKKEPNPQKDSANIFNSPIDKDFKKKVIKFSFPIIIILCFVVYIQTIFFDFVYLDDYSIIVDEIIAKIGGLSSIFKSFTFSYGGNFYRPIQTFSFVIDYAIGGGNPIIYHLGNLVFHCITCCILLYFLRTLKYNDFTSLIVTAIYSIHPLFTHTVAWIPSRGDIFFTLFSVLAVTYYVKYFNDKKLTNFTLHSVFFLLSILSKETALSLPFVCLAYLILIKKQSIFKKESFYFYLSWFAAVIIWYLLRSMSNMNELDSRVIGISQFITNLPTIPEYISKFFIPINISVLPTFRPFSTISGLVLIAALVTFIFLRKEKRTSYIIFGTIWFLFLLLPVLIFRHPQSDQFYDYMDHRAYLPIIGLLIILLEIFPKQWLKFDKKIALIVSLILVILLSGLTYAQSRNYRTPVRFWKNAIKNDKTRGEFYFSLGFYYFKWKRNSDAAEKYFAQSAKLNPTSEPTQTHLGLIYYERGEFEKAITHYRNSIMLNRDALEPRINLGSALNRAGRYDESIAISKTALYSDKYRQTALFNIFDAYRVKQDIDSSLIYARILRRTGATADFSGAFVNWGAKYYHQKEYNKAIEVTNYALEFNPRNAQAYCNLGLFNMEMSRLNESEKFIQKALEYDPNLLNAYMNMFNLYFQYYKDYKKAALYARELQKRGGTITNEQLKALSQYL